MAKINRTSAAYVIRAISPLHMGAGDANYGVIDNLVQRDCLTNYPIIHSSSLKGALREYFEFWLPNKYEEKEAAKKVNLIFGKGSQDGKENKDATEFAAGLFDFDLGFLLSLPVRTDKAAWVSATTVDILNGFIKRLELFGIEAATSIRLMLEPLLKLIESNAENALVFAPALDGAILEDEDFKAKYVPLENIEAIENLFGKNFAVLPAYQFADLAERLPVIARNYLENGQSKNLWYEEVVPRESRFYTTVSRAAWKNSNHSMEELASLFDQTLQEKRIQLGGNATVGYGKTVFTQL